ncbi:LytTR family DNA-binding domain-containing protein [Thalassobius sp. S69A]|uniref:LytTR family DNA-binding domain-containing protein n=1 Tax=unclassified Thalassovita TaxID=2619711 RepID=UPI000C0CDE4E|nr:DNA-binding protein [Paracoccaceae bacterium]MBA84507.1 DNA-binding protein [Paracoccaceae bacterium]MBT27071.1 DNA-binding protein [Paracoccaceae bacterium]
MNLLGIACVTMKNGPLHLALRQRPEIVTPLVLWIALSVLGGLTGPFETYELLSGPARLMYWACVAGVSILTDLGFRRLLAGQGLWRRLAARLGFAIVLGGMLHGLNALVFDGWGGLRQGLWMIGVVWIVAMIVEAVVALIHHFHLPAVVQTDAAEQPAADAVFQKRLPLERRGALIRIESQDHYLNVVTDAGAALILMRLSDAEKELAGFAGLRVHRSHWVATGQVQQVLRRNGQLFLRMPDGAQVPVSRTYKPRVEAAGLRP